MLITRRHGSWVVLGTLVTDVELEPTPPLDLDCGSCTLCIDACPTGALDEPGMLDATRCLSYWTQAPAPIPEAYRAELGGAGLRLRHLPGRVPVEPRGREAPRGASRRRPAPSRTSRSSTGSRPTTAELARALRPPVRAAQRRAATCSETRSSRSATSAGRAPAAARAVFDDRRRAAPLSTPSGRSRSRRGAARRRALARAPRAGAQLAAQLRRLEHDGLAALREHLADEPLLAAELQLRERRCRREEGRAPRSTARRAGSPAT